MEEDFHGEVRSQAQAALVRQGGQAQQLSNATNTGCIRLNDIATVGVDHTRMRGDESQHFTRSDRHIQDLGEVRLVFEVVGVQRLFNPDQVEFLQLASHPRSGGAVPLLVGVDHERNVPGDMLANHCGSTPTTDQRRFPSLLELFCHVDDCYHTLSQWTQTTDAGEWALDIENWISDLFGVGRYDSAPLNLWAHKLVALLAASLFDAELRAFRQHFVNNHRTVR